MPWKCQFTELGITVSPADGPTRTQHNATLVVSPPLERQSAMEPETEDEAAIVPNEVCFTFEPDAAAALFHPVPPENMLVCAVSAIQTNITKCMATITLASSDVITIDFTACRPDFAMWRSVFSSFADMAFHTTRDHSSAKEYFGYYALLSQQQNMLTDFTRTSTYQYACLANSAQFKDKVVCDVGCGTGILSFFSARAGARKVYGVDASNMADRAQALVVANGKSDVITIIKGKVEDIDLPEQVDILISEPMGMALLNERMLESYVHARKFLKPGGTMFPTSSTMYCAPFTDEQLYQEMSSRASFWNSENFFGVDLQALKAHARHEVFRQPVIDASPAQNLLGHPAAISFDFLTITEEELHEVVIPVHFEAEIPVTVHGLSIWFDVLFDGEVEKVFLSTSPASPVTHWYQTRCVFNTPQLLSPGEVLICTLKFTANDKQSYDIRIESVRSPSNERFVDKYNLKEPHFRLDGYFSTFSGRSTPAQFGASAAAAVPGAEPSDMST